MSPRRGCAVCHAEAPPPKPGSCAYPSGWHWIPQRGGVLCSSCAERCQCGAIVPDARLWDAITGYALCTGCTLAKLRGIDLSPREGHSGPVR